MDKKRIVEGNPTPHYKERLTNTNVLKTKEKYQSSGVLSTEQAGFIPALFTEEAFFLVVVSTGCSELGPENENKNK